MLFYEDLIKKIEDSKNEKIELNNIEKFGLVFAKRISGYGIAFSLIAIGLFQVYSFTVYHKWYMLLIGIVLFGLGLKQFKNIITYTIKIDTVLQKLRSGKLDLNFSNINTAILKEMKIGKKVVPVIDIITNDKRQVIIPLYMEKQLRFIILFKQMLNEKFSIVK